MTPPSLTPKATPLPPTAVWWVLWFSLISGVAMLYFFLHPWTNPTPHDIGYVALVPLTISVVVRFLILPRIKTRSTAFPVFVAGLATAEASGVLGIFLAGSRAGTFVALSIGMLLTYAPFFLCKYDGPSPANPFRAS